MVEMHRMSLADIEKLSLTALMAAGASGENAKGLAAATAATEADGVASHGLAYIPIYAEHLICGKVDGKAEPSCELTAPSVLSADAKSGFAHPAIDLGFEQLMPLAKTQGIAALSIRNSYNCGVLGYHTYRIACAGLMGIGFTNAPASIAPSGGNKPAVGTNPFSISAPDGQGGAALLIDQSASTIAKSEIMKHAREGHEIPLGWALDADGQPTTDPNKALTGSMAPSGGYKGVGIALMVELMAAAMSGATLGIHASPFSGTKGGPPKTGQFFMAIDPAATSGGAFAERLSDLVGWVHDQEGARLPGDGRGAKRARAMEQGVDVNVATISKIEAIIHKN